MAYKKRKLNQMKGPYYYLNNANEIDDKRADKNVLDNERVWVQDKPRAGGKGVGKIYWVGTTNQAFDFLSKLPLGKRSFYEYISIKDYVRPFLDF
jgi:hypothetical protein